MPSTDSFSQAIERAQMAALARRFYLDGRSQVEIGEEFGISRFRVARLLSQARELGIVDIRIREDVALGHELGDALANRFGLKAAHVVAAWGEVVEVRRTVAEAAAVLLSRRLDSNDVLGMSWGRTLADLTSSVAELPPVTVVQLTGAVAGELEHSPVEILRRLSARAGGEALAIFAPMVVDSAETVAVIKRQPDVERAMRRFDDLTVTLLAIGSWDPLDSQLALALPESERAGLIRAGVRAEVASILITDDGEVIGQEFTDRTISVTAAQLRRCPDVIGVVAGRHKTQAVAAVCRSGLISELVCDHQLAQALLDLPQH